MNDIEWKIKEDCFKRPQFDSYDFWYDITLGGYINPDECLSIEQAKILKDAIDIVESFRECFEEFCLDEEE